jgi:hypothetical protein
MGDLKNVQSARGRGERADRGHGTTGAVPNRLSQTHNRQDYLFDGDETPFSSDAGQDFAHELAETVAMVASRHHF